MAERLNILVTIPGVAYRIAREGSPDDLAVQALERAELRRVGRGGQAILAMNEDEANALADYYWSVAGVVADMTVDERDGGNEQGAAQQAILRIESALRRETASRK